MSNEYFMRKAIEIAVKNVKNGGGPFGAIIVRNGEIIAAGGNRVTANNDPTAHAEITAIREACLKLGSFNLEGCTIYTSCEPCPMCLSAIYWAHIDKVYFGADKNDATRAGFDDSFIYDEISLPRKERKKTIEAILCDENLSPFNEWAQKNDKIKY